MLHNKPVVLKLKDFYLIEIGHNMSIIMSASVFGTKDFFFCKILHQLTICSTPKALHFFSQFKLNMHTQFWYVRKAKLYDCSRVEYYRLFL